MKTSYTLEEVKLLMNKIKFYDREISYTAATITLMTLAILDSSGFIALILVVHIFGGLFYFSNAVKCRECGKYNNRNDECECKEQPEITFKKMTVTCKRCKTIFTAFGDCEWYRNRRQYTVPYNCPKCNNYDIQTQHK